MSVATWMQGDAFEQMAKIPDGSVDLIVTSPPFLALRSYLPADHPDKSKEIGSEATPAAFLTTLLALTREWRRVLAPHGSICVELGDTYSGSGGAGGDYKLGGLREGQDKFEGSAYVARQDTKYPKVQRGDMAGGGITNLHGKVQGGGSGWPLDKSLCLLPTLYPASLAYGRNLLDPDDVIDPWRIRNLVVWHRPNPPVGALGDKVRPSTSYVTIACTRRDRWFDLDAERTEHKDHTLNYAARRKLSPGTGYVVPERGDGGGFTGDINPAGAPPLDYWQLNEDDPAEHQAWTIPTQPFSGAHYATFPIALPRRLIRLMCPMHVCRQCGMPRRRITAQTDEAYAEVARQAKGYGLKRNGSESGAAMGYATGNKAQSMIQNGVIKPTIETVGWSDCGHDNYRRGVVLDCFGGSGTTGAAAVEQGRDCILIDLDSRNLELARQRIGLFLEEAS